MRCVDGRRLRLASRIALMGLALFSPRAASALDAVPELLGARLTCGSARFSTAIAASLTASGSVGWAWQVRAMSSEEPANSIGDGFGDHVAGAGADDVDAEHAVGLGVGEDLDDAFGLVHGLGAAVGEEGEFADLVGDARCLELLFGEADRAISGWV